MGSDRSSATDRSEDSDLPCGCDHVDISCDAKDCPLKPCAFKDKFGRQCTRLRDHKGAHHV